MYLIFDLDRLCRGGIPVRRFIFHGAVNEAERETGSDPSRVQMAAEKSE